MTTSPGALAPVIAIRPPDPGRRNLAWQDDALCAQVGGDLFFPKPGDGAASNAAKKVCGECTVRYDCLVYGLHHGGRYGVWGGVPQRDLQSMRARLGIHDRDLELADLLGIHNLDEAAA